MSELKACPFCGKEQQPDVPGDGNVPYTNQSRMCDWCGCYVGSNWNTRPIEDELQRRIDELTAENAASQERIEDLELRLDVYNGNMYDVVVLENERLRSELASLREQVRWIPVDEKEPEHGVRYDVWLANNYQVKATYFNHDSNFMKYANPYWMNDCGVKISNVTHYKFLPKPPKEVKE